MGLPLSASVIDASLQAWLPRADGGDFVAMAYVAMLRQLSGAPPEETGNWLRRAMVSDDADFVVALGEELVIGTPLPRNLPLARDCFQRAMTLSEAKGSYAMARFLIGSDRKRAVQLFERAAQLGHLPSRHVLLTLRQPKAKAARLLFRLRHAPGLFLDARKLFNEPPGGLRWWRYKDVFNAPDQAMEKRLGEERTAYFPWARPSPLAAFVLAVVKGVNTHLQRGPVDEQALRPQPRTPATPAPPAQDELKPPAWVRVPIQIGFVVLLFWLISHLTGSLATVPTLRNVPPDAAIQVSLHLKDSSGIFDTVRVEDFADDTAERNVMLSEPPAKDGEHSRGVFLALHGFERNHGGATLEVLPFGWTEAPLTVHIPDYQHCGSARDFGPIADIRICTLKAVQQELSHSGE